MALTLNAPVSATLVSTGAYVVGILDQQVTTSKLFVVPTFTFTEAGAGGVPSAAAYDPPNGMDLPTVQSVQVVTAWDGVSTDAQVGYVKLTLAPAANDLVNSASPMDFVVSPNALVLTATADV